MLSKKEVKDIQSLSLKKHRDAVQLFVAEGPKLVQELLQSSTNLVQKIFATENWLQQNAHLAGTANIRPVSEQELQRISQLQTPNQVLAVCRQLKSEAPVTTAFVLYLDTIQDPGNFGTIIRIADWFGIKHVVCSPGCADVYNSKVVQATMGSIARVNIYYERLTAEWLKQQQLPLYAATLHGRSLHTVAKTASGILLVGNESKGLQPELVAMATESITISRRGQAESLNAAVATGIILSHLLQ